MSGEQTFQKSELELVRSAREGDRSAFKTLYEQNRGRIYNLTYYMLGDPIWAQDVLQTVFMKAYRGLSRFRVDSSFGTWVYRIALNECQNQLRRRRAHTVPIESVLGSDEEVDSARRPDLEHYERQRAGIVQRAVMDLPPKFKAVVVMKYFEGLSYGEMAAVLGCSQGTVASRIHRALVRVEQTLRPLRGAI